MGYIKACLHVSGNNPAERAKLMKEERGRIAGEMPLSKPGESRSKGQMEEASLDRSVDGCPSQRKAGRCRQVSR